MRAAASMLRITPDASIFCCRPGRRFHGHLRVSTGSMCDYRPWSFRHLGEASTRKVQRECASRRSDDTRGDSSLRWVCASKVHDSTQTSCPAHGAAQMHAHRKRTPPPACWGASGRGCVPQAHGPWLSHTHPSAPRRGGVLDSEWWRLGRCGARGSGGPTRRGGPAREAPFFVFLRPRVALAVGALIIAGKRLGLL